MVFRFDTVNRPGRFLIATGAVTALLLSSSALAGDRDKTGDSAIDAAIRMLETMRGGNEKVQPAGPAGAGSLPSPIVDADYYPRDAAKESLGQLLFFDKIISGNQNISCATCHHPLAGTGDGLSLPVGEGGAGLGVTRNTGEGSFAVPERVPRNAPHVFNLGAIEFVGMFHDGRVAIDASQPSGFLNPAGDDLPSGLDHPLAVQAMFPPTSGTEMAGQPGENTVADAAAAGNLAGDDGVWAQLAARVANVEKYAYMFVAAFPDVAGPEDITFVHIANAIGAYEAAAFRADDSAFDRYLRGDNDALSANELAGMNLFYGAAGCSECHSGKFLTDQSFHALAIPQIGPGKGDNLPGYSDGHDDFGREHVTGDPEDRFRFRTPPLRNVALTSPYGHDGAYSSLEMMVRHHLNPVASLNAYDRSQAVLPHRDSLNQFDFIVQLDANRRSLIADMCDVDANPMSDEDIKKIVDFLFALTDERSLNLSREVPKAVPSGLPMHD